jgi:hypothetical protein
MKSRFDIPVSGIGSLGCGQGEIQCSPLGIQMTVKIETASSSFRCCLNPAWPVGRRYQKQSDCHSGRAAIRACRGVAEGEDGTKGVRPDP